MFFVKQTDVQIRRQITKYVRLSEELAPGEIDPYTHFKFNVILPAITLALDLINNNSYGHCIDCGSSIPTERLELVQEALRCLQCRQISESRG